MSNVQSTTPSKAKKIVKKSAAQPTADTPQEVPASIQAEPIFAPNTQPDVPSNVPTNFVRGAGTRTPWWGLSEELKQGETVYDALGRAGLDFEVAVSPIRYGEDFKFETDSRRGLYRTDDGTLFDMPGRGYIPLQNREVAEIFEQVVASGDMRIDTIGGFEHGKRNWFLVDMGESFDVDAGPRVQTDDRVDGKILFYWSHVYGEGGWYKTTQVRVICANTLSHAKHDGSELFKFWHNKKFGAVEIEKARQMMATARKEFTQFKEQAGILARVKLNLLQAQQLAVHIVGKHDHEFKDQPKIVHRVMSLFSGEGMGAAMASADGTAWGLLNAVTQFTDWEYGNAKTSQESRLNRAWGDTGSAVKGKANRTLLDFASGKLRLPDLPEIAAAQQQVAPGALEV